MELRVLLAVWIAAIAVLPTTADPACNIRAQTVSPDSIVRSGVGPYSYVAGAANGPENWGKILCGGFYKCKTGKYQSPIDVKKQSTWTPSCKLNLKIEASVDAKMQYAPTPNDFMFNCMNNFDGCGRIIYRDVAYDMLQVHIHSPSEHRIDGRKYPMEIHFVHRNVNDFTIAVLGVFFEEGAYNPALTLLFDAALRRSYSNVNLSQLLGDVKVNPKPCTFMGSLTTPPCTEGINWILSTNPITAAPSQISLFRNMTGRSPNNRPLQSALGRSVRCFDSGNTMMNQFMPYCTNEHY